MGEVARDQRGENRLFDSNLGIGTLGEARAGREGPPQAPLTHVFTPSEDAYGR